MSTYTSEPGTRLAGRYRLVDQTSAGPGWTFWKAVDAVPLRGSTFRECYHEIANGLVIQSAELPDYFPMLKKAMLTWTDLFTE